jgi:enamine deaminase RidA (YjgF/YER057c/UK114 family)
MPSERLTISSGTPWEAAHGYCRALRVGNVVYVSGTVASDEDGAVVGPDDPYAQAVYSIQKIERALGEAGASLADVVRTRLYVTDISRWQEVSRAHAAFFGEIRPASTMVEVRALIAPEFLVEIEVEAVVGAA